MPTEYTICHYIGFLVIVLICLWVDLHAHKSDRPITMRNALIWTCIWVSLALFFAVYIGVTHSSQHVSLYLAGYFLEKSLSVDNIFVMMAIFSAFAIRDKYQHRVLYYGILGALALRILFVAAGTGLVEAFGTYALAAFGLFVLWSAWKMWQHMRKPDEDIQDYSAHWSVRWSKRLFPVYPHVESHDFFVKKPQNNGGKLVWMVTPLFLCLIVIELTDVIFAFDSIPAIIAITQDPFLVYTSNVFAILGMRSLYFLMAGAKKYLCYLEKTVIVILAFIGVKMLLDVITGIHIPPLINLLVVLGLLFAGILASLIRAKKSDKNESANSKSGSQPQSASVTGEKS